jgi:hypothetical protein
MKNPSISLIVGTLLLLLSTSIKAQELVPKSANDKVLPDAEARSLLETLKDSEIRSLRDLIKVYVVSDRVTRDLITQGFRIDDVISSIEVSLNNAGIKTVNLNEFKTMGAAGFPFLKIKFEITKDSAKENNYNGLVKVALTQRVITSRFTNTSTTAASPPVSTSVYYPNVAGVFAETWHTQKAVLNQTRENVARMVVDIVVNEFLKDHKAANKPPPKK